MKKVPQATDLPIGEHKSFIVDGEGICIYRKDETTFYTFADVCTHDGAPICSGKTQGDSLVCPRHGAIFNMRTGKVEKMPASSPLDVYPNKIKEGELYVDLDA